ncbi:hypothetical protein LCGC14_0906910 [marine sediment metagenome]|uniref:Uncharacterized protein n=1 Tax=marine sediment metagenome TaxID=412755 RepID=A0A0F9RDP5_9ZZZZ
MTTLLALYNRHGCVGRCDAKCFNAKTDICTCVCGGMNHSVGLAMAYKNTQDHCQELIDGAKKFHTLSRITFPLGIDQQQLF